MISLPSIIVELIVPLLSMLLFPQIDNLLTEELHANVCIIVSVKSSYHVRWFIRGLADLVHLKIKRNKMLLMRGALQTRIGTVQAWRSL